ncbi:hypothetical protein GCM10010218_18880 [Streptomyces mashuensis]|uniref:HTH iclR-type domain-containing protein n=1 Tax=Streptomyces mashuensis TaxID=33904 RepID=A0A919B2D2_9ACTN|nr:hypothetical protein [Streptomyces mashuensis]GHF37971.1 hypothetical protein GCM10010218_18880 [Streptomyces mashuensis]
MSKRQKGRRHRRVNRTPRPAGPPRPRPGTAVVHAASAPRLGRHEARTWEGLRALGTGGASVEELSAAVGYQARTVLKHVNGLAGQGLAELRGDRWYATAPAAEGAAGR